MSIWSSPETVILVIGGILLLLFILSTKDEPPEEWNSDWIYENCSPRDFELLVTELWDSKDFSAEVSKNGADGGIDVAATKQGVSVAIEAKLYNPETNKVGRPVIQKAVGASKQYGYSKTVVITTSGFSKPAVQSEHQLKSKHQSVELYNGDKLTTELNDSALEPKNLSDITQHN